MIDQIPLDGPAIALHHGDCLDVLRSLPDNSIDSVVTDPPYGLTEHKRANVEKALLAWLTGDREHVPDGKGFMGRSWDAFVPPPAMWDECFRVLKPGGHLLAFCGSRTIDLMMMSIRLAGLTESAAPEIRDSIAWLYGSGFPKSRDVSKDIDKAAGAQREVIGPNTTRHGGGLGVLHGGGLGVLHGGGIGADTGVITAPATPAAQQWSGWGTALKPAFEPVVVARKPLAGTVAGNVQEWGTGALNIDACRVAGGERPLMARIRTDDKRGAEFTPEGSTSTGETTTAGRWPANVALDGSQADALDQQSGWSKSPPVGSVANKQPRIGQVAKGDEAARVSPNGHGDSGGASRFFPTFRYQAKAPTRERPSYVNEDGQKVAHATVKPLELMRWLVRLVTPPGGTVLEPFAGSGTTVEACLLEGFQCTAIEREAEYLPLIKVRVERQGASCTVVETTPVRVEPVKVDRPAPTTEPAAMVAGDTWADVAVGDPVVGQGGLVWTVADILIAGGRANVTVSRDGASKTFNVSASANVRRAEVDRAA